jgi:transcriptional regulator GlxA family with amidase domain
MSATPVRIGVLLIGTVQMLDLSPIDLFGMLNKEYLEACRLPAPLVALAVPVEIVYISESGAGINDLTASAGLRVSADLNDKCCAPGNLDILMVPGPDPSTKPSDAVTRFMRGHVEGGATILTICTGVFMAGYAEILDGNRATGPRALLPELRKKFPRVTWESRRWTHDGKIWTSGIYPLVISKILEQNSCCTDETLAGITNGLDMVAKYIRTTWPGPLAEAVCAMADVGDRGQEYENATAIENAWWVWQILRAWRKGFFH